MTRVQQTPVQMELHVKRCVAFIKFIILNTYTKFKWHYFNLALVLCYRVLASVDSPASVHQVSIFTAEFLLRETTLLTLSNKS